MTVEQVEALAAEMADSITAMVQQFERDTRCIVHSLPVRPAAGTQPATVEVRIQLA